MSQSEEERFVEAWIAKTVKAEGYESDDDHAAKLADQCVTDGPHSREAIEAEIGDLTQRMSMAIETATETVMMERDGRSGYPESVELPPGHKKEMLEAEAERARRKADD